jgi:molybdopterin biosynthesis enzyme
VKECGLQSDDLLITSSTVSATLLMISEVPLGSELAMDIHAIDDLPLFPASVMDGYAVSELDFSSVFPIVDAKMLAGVDPNLPLGNSASGNPVFGKSSKRAIYVTTGGPVPSGFIAVVPVEDCKVTGTDLDLRDVDSSQYSEGTWIRKVGSDIQKD